LGKALPLRESVFDRSKWKRCANFVIILAVADTYNALTSWRPYRDRWDHRAAFAEMQRDAKKGKFDPQVMETLGKLLEM
jgi:hypothetical protein